MKFLNCAANVHYDCDESEYRNSASIEEPGEEVKVMSIVVRSNGPLGIKIGQHKQYRDFSVIQSFVRGPNGTKYELEEDGRLQVGDAIVAVNRQNLVSFSSRSVREILSSASTKKGPRVLTFLRPGSNFKPSKVSKVHESSPSRDEGASLSPSQSPLSTSSTDDNSIDSMSSHSNLITQGIYVDPPTGKEDKHFFFKYNFCYFFSFFFYSSSVSYNHYHRQ